jgi:hypothetical protein
LRGREGTEHQCSDDEREHAAGLLLGEPVARATDDVRELAVHQPSHLREQCRIAHRLGKDADPAFRGDEVGPLVEPQRGVGIGRERIAFVVAFDARPKTPHEIFEQAAQQLGLVLEMMVDQARRDAGFGRHRRHRRAGVSVLGHHTRECGDELASALLAIARSTHRLVV